LRDAPSLSGSFGPVHRSTHERGLRAFSVSGSGIEATRGTDFHSIHLYSGKLPFEVTTSRRLAGRERFTSELREQEITLGEPSTRQPPPRVWETRDPLRHLLRLGPWPRRLSRVFISLNQIKHLHPTPAFISSAIEIESRKHERRKHEKFERYCQRTVCRNRRWCPTCIPFVFSSFVLS
jgi:hypothetical protein